MSGLPRPVRLARALEMLLRLRPFDTAEYVETLRDELNFRDERIKAAPQETVLRHLGEALAESGCRLLPARAAGWALDLAGRVAWVPGGTGAVGRAVVAALLSAGASVFVSYRHEGGWQEARRGWPSGDDRLCGLPGDLTEEAAARAAVDECVRRFGRLDFLLHVAGGFFAAPLADTEPARWQAMQQGNLGSAYLCARAAWPHLMAGGGRIVFIGSRTAQQAGPRSGAYASAKAGLVPLAQALAEEGRPHGITANVLLPGIIDTAANRSAMPTAPREQWLSPEHLADVLLLLCSPAAAAISGAAIALQQPAGGPVAAVQPGTGPGRPGAREPGQA